MLVDWIHLVECCEHGYEPCVLQMTVYFFAVRTQPIIYIIQSSTEVTPVDRTARLRV
jgi:hypothetical protein